jgi:hypothetical protein
MCHQHLVGQLYLMPLLTKVLELEGQRFWDLVRWGKASTELAGTGC